MKTKFPAVYQPLVDVSLILVIIFLLVCYDLSLQELEFHEKENNELKDEISRLKELVLSQTDYNSPDEQNLISKSTEIVISSYDNIFIDGNEVLLGDLDTGIPLSGSYQFFTDTNNHDLYLKVLSVCLKKNPKSIIRNMVEQRS